MTKNCQTLCCAFLIVKSAEFYKKTAKLSLKSKPNFPLFFQALAPETEATSTTPIEAVNRVAQQQKAKAQGRQMQSRIRQTMPSHQYQAREVEVEEFPEESRW